MAPVGSSSTGKAQVIIEEELKAEEIRGLCTVSGGSCGLIVGQVHGGKFLVCHFIRACKDVSPDENDGGRFRLVGVSHSKENLENMKPETMDTEKEESNLDESDDDNERGDGDGKPNQHWVLDRKRSFYPCHDVKHLFAAQLPSLARQVSRLLPGGLRVLGVFFTTNEEIPKTSRPRLRDLLMDISATVRKDCPGIFQDAFSLQDDKTDEMLVLAFDPKTNMTITSLCLDAADAKCIIKPIPVTYQKCKWTTLHTRFRIDQEEPTDVSQDVESILKHTLEEFRQQLQDSVCLFNDKTLDHQNALPTFSSHKTDSSAAVHVAFLVPLQQTSFMEENVDEGEDEHKKDKKKEIQAGNDLPVIASGRMGFRGDVVGRAYVAHGSTVDYAQKAIKGDLLRSMASRIKLHCEDYLVTDSDEQEFDVVHELPRRVLAPLKNSPITFSNYLHEGEQVKESLEVFVGLLDMCDNLNTSELLTNVENIPDQYQVDSALESVSTHSGELEESPSQNDLSQLGEEGASTASNSYSRASSSTSLQDEQDRPNQGRLQSLMVVMAVIFAVCFGIYQIYLYFDVEDTEPARTEEISGGQDPMANMKEL